MDATLKSSTSSNTVGLTSPLLFSFLPAGCKAINASRVSVTVRPQSASPSLSLVFGLDQGGEVSLFSNEPCTVSGLQDSDIFYCTTLSYTYGLLILQQVQMLR